MEESVSLFRAMTAGEMEDGAAVVRLKIDMASPNMNLRDPTIYRIKRSASRGQEKAAAGALSEPSRIPAVGPPPTRRLGTSGRLRRCGLGGGGV